MIKMYLFENDLNSIIFQTYEFSNLEPATSYVMKVFVRDTKTHTVYAPSVTVVMSTLIGGKIIYYWTFQYFYF